MSYTDLGKCSAINICNFSFLLTGVYLGKGKVRVTALANARNTAVKSTS